MRTRNLLVGVLIGFCSATVFGDDGDAAQNYWSQFNDQHVTGIPVQEYLARWDVSLLWEGAIGDDTYALCWQSEPRTVLVEKNGKQLEDTMTGEDVAFRPTFEADFRDGVPHIAGFIDVDEVNEIVVLEVRSDDDSGFEPLRMGVVRDSIDRDVNPRPTQCKCYGLGGAATRSCTAKDCDDPVSCGHNKWCQWRASG